MSGAAPALRGFTLLEVLVAIAILGLGLTTILSAQTGLFAGSSYAEHVSVGVGLARCKLSELELELEKKGYGLTDTSDEGRCCGDETDALFTCKWKVERVELPPPAVAGDPSLGSDPAATGGGLGPIAGIAAVGQSGGAALGETPDLGDVASLLAGTQGGPAAAGAMGEGSTSLAPLVMGLVYPKLKPLLEASIRKVTVSVVWREGLRTRDLSVTQFVTNPQQGGLDPNAAQGLEAAADAVGNLLGASPAAPKGPAQ